MWGKGNKKKKHKKKRERSEADRQTDKQTNRKQKTENSWIFKIHIQNNVKS